MAATGYIFNNPLFWGTEHVALIVRTPADFCVPTCSGPLCCKIISFASPVWVRLCPLPLWYGKATIPFSWSKGITSQQWISTGIIEIVFISSMEADISQELFKEHQPLLSEISQIQRASQTSLSSSWIIRLKIPGWPWKRAVQTSCWRSPTAGLGPVPAVPISAGNGVHCGEGVREAMGWWQLWDFGCLGAPPYCICGRRCVVLWSQPLLALRTWWVMHVLTEGSLASYWPPYQPTTSVLHYLLPAPGRARQAQGTAVGMGTKSCHQQLLKQESAPPKGRLDFPGLIHTLSRVQAELGWAHSANAWGWVLSMGQFIISICCNGPWQQCSLCWGFLQGTSPLNF